jgi:FlaA1/EpsC-like NDP-sugar epimerase
LEKINLVLIGTGETARLAFEYFTYDSNFQDVGFAINHALMKADSFCGLPVTPFEQLESYYSKEHNQVFVAIGSGRLNRDRALLFSKVKDKGYTCASYVSRCNDG